VDRDEELAAPLAIVERRAKDARAVGGVRRRPGRRRRAKRAVLGMEFDERFAAVLRQRGDRPVRVIVCHWSR
jgi:hypothetical protein